MSLGSDETDGEFFFFFFEGGVGCSALGRAVDAVIVLPYTVDLR